MTVFVITYDLSAPGRNYDAIIARIKQYPWVNLSESSWAVRTDSTSSQIRDYLGSVLDANDKLFVGTLRSPASWQGLSKDRADWLQQNLK